MMVTLRSRAKLEPSVTIVDDTSTLASDALASEFGPSLETLPLDVPCERLPRRGETVASWGK